MKAKYCKICKKECDEVLYSSKDNTLARYGFLKHEENLVETNNLEINIYFCSACNFGWNEDFDYSLVDYDSDKIIEAGNFSQKYFDYQINSAHHLKKLMGFAPKMAVEVGAGAGIFLNAIDAKSKVAIEPSDESKKIDSSIEVHNTYFSKDRFNFPAELVASRQVLEHIDEPLAFLNDIKESFKKDDKFYLYLEVPNSEMTFNEGRFYDYYYEHCNYFTPESLIALSRELNMKVVNISSAMNSELISILLTTESEDSKILKAKIDNNLRSIKEKISSYSDANKTMIAWGASGNGVQILNKLAINKEIIPYIIDSDLNKQGLYIPGTLQEIIDPDSAVELNPEVVFVFTQFHKEEIGEQCRSLFGNIEIEFI